MERIELPDAPLGDATAIIQPEAAARPLRALDLFCCGGGASMGLKSAGFEVIGVDIEPQPKYPFEFHQADAMEFCLEGFDFIWASPPCQGYSEVTPLAHRGKYDKLIHEIRDRLVETGVPYCIENVNGAKRELRNPMMLCGSMFGLRSERHRFFETNFEVAAPRECDHSQLPLMVTTAGSNTRRKRELLGLSGPHKSVYNAPLAYGIDWMGYKELREAIPPAYAEYIAKAALATVVKV